MKRFRAYCNDDDCTGALTHYKRGFVLKAAWSHWLQNGHDVRVKRHEIGNALEAAEGKYPVETPGEVSKPDL